MQGLNSDPPISNYNQALNWFERAANLGDSRITDIVRDKYFLNNIFKTFIKFKY